MYSDRRKLEKQNFILVCFDVETKYTFFLKAEKIKFAID